MLNNKITISLLIVSVFLSSCVINKPDSYSISKADYNKRKTISGAHYKKKLSAIGYGAVIGSVASGAYIGYNTNLISKQEGVNTVPVRPANAAIGAILGYSISMLGNYAMGYNKKVRNPDPEKWLKKANKEYILISQSSSSNFEVMHKSAEQSYVLKNMKDAIDFVSTFPNSSYANDVAKQSINASNFKSNDYLQLMRMFPNNSSMLEMKKQYVYRATTLSNMFYAFDKFPETKINIEKESLQLQYSIDDIGQYIKRFPKGVYYNKSENKAVSYVNNYSGATKFKKIFPASLQNKQVVINAFKNISISDAIKLKKKYRNDFYLTADDIRKYNASSKSKRNYINFKYNLLSTKLTTQWLILDFYKENEYLMYNGVENDILDNIWNKTIHNFNSGEYFIETLMAISKINDYRSLKISDYAVERFVSKKLKKEFQNNFYIKSEKFVSSKDINQSEWDNNTIKTPIVFSRSKHTGAYEIVAVNNSIFDIPVEFILNGYYMLDFDVNMPIFKDANFLKGIARFFGKATGLSEQIREMENSTKTKVHPIRYETKMPRNKTTKFAIPINNIAPAQISNIGINLFDIVDYQYRVTFTDSKLTYNYLTKNISKSSQERFNQLMMLYQTKEYRSKTYDILRLKEYNPKDDVKIRQEIAEMMVKEVVPSDTYSANLINARIKLTKHPYAQKQKRGYNVEIFSRDKECDESYFSVIYTHWKNGEYRKEIKLEDEMEDNHGTYLRADDFPIKVTVSYKEKPCSSGNRVKADVLIYTPDYYTLEVKPD